MYTRVAVVLLCAAIVSLRAEGAGVGEASLSREEAVRQALERNPEVISARKEWDAARARLLQTRAFPDPELELEFAEVPGGFSLGQFGERNIGAVQKIEFPVKWWLRNRAVGFRAEAVKFSTYEMAKLDVAGRVNTAFDRVLTNQEILAYAEENLQLAQDFMAKARLRFNAGDVAQLEVLRAEVEAGRAENGVRIARNAVSVSRAELNALLAQDISTQVEVVGELVYEPVARNLELLMGLALERRPDLQGAERRTEGARAARSAAVTSVIPDLNLGVFRQTLRSPAGQEKAWRVSFGLEVPLWGMFRQRGEIAEAGAEMAQAEAQADIVRYQVKLDVQRALLDLTAAEERVKLFKDRILPGAEQAYVFANRGYQEGKATYLELLEAQRGLTQTRLEHAETLFTYRAARAALERATGGELPE